VFLIKIPSKGKKTIVSRMIKDVQVSIFSFHQCQNARRKRSYVLALVSTDAALEDASVGPEVHSFARIERACSKWPQSACKTRGARRPIGKKKKKSKAMTEARRNERAKCAAKVKERSGTRRRQARTTAADGGRQQ
jgi:hypothetical protein